METISKIYSRIGKTLYNIFEIILYEENYIEILLGNVRWKKNKFQKRYGFLIFQGFNLLIFETKALIKKTCYTKQM